MSGDNTASSLAFKFFEVVSKKVLGFLINVIMARLLAPEIFGIVAIITAIVALMEVFITGGFSVALIQNKDTTDRDYSTVFYISMGVASLIYAGIFFATPYITAFYEIPGYELHFHVLTLIMFLYAFNSIQISKMSREMQFKKMMVCNLIATVTSGVLGIVLALLDFGIWALIFYYLSNALATCVAYAFVVKWRPRLIFDTNRAKILFSFGNKMLLSGLLCSLFNNIRTFIIGRFYTKEQLGLYSRGNELPNVVAMTIDNTFNAVMLPVFARNQDDKKTIRAMLSKTVSNNSYFNFPAMIGLAVVAYNLILVVYTEKWLGSVPFMQIFCMASLAFSIISPVLVAIKALGESKVYLRLETVRRIVMLAMLGGSLFFQSLEAIALSWMISCLVDVVLVMVPVKKIIGYTFGDLAKDTLPILAVSLIMGGAVWAVGLLNFSPLVSLVLQVACGGLLYVLLSALFKLKSFVDFKDKAMEYIKGKKQ